ncbi:MAG: BamA/TamA family outer membrane protein [Lewinellaceae bacterium]|nr:BamA/TamA family outer membrane protein [Lewinellaceae bacterium]
MRAMLHWFLVLILATSPWTGFAQTLRLHVAPDDAKTIEPLVRNLSPRPQVFAPDSMVLVAPNAAALDTAVLAFLALLRQNTWLAASVDDRRPLNDSTATARLYLGPPMYWVQLRAATDANARWLDAAGFREKLFTNKPLRYDFLLRQQRLILERAENNGFPFAAVRLDSVLVQPDGGVSAMIAVDRGRFFTFAEPKVTGGLQLPRRYLPQYLGLRPGMPYSRDRVLRIRDRLNALLFVETLANPTVTFAGDEARVNLFVQKKRASRFDFIIGLLPQPNNPDGGLLLTGSLNAALLNALNLGERLSIELERLRPETQKLDLQIGLPYLFGLPFGMEGRLNIFRRDSTWVDAQSEVGVQYLLEGGDFVKFFWENKSSALQRIDTAAIIQTRRLPAALDLRQNGFGLETALNRLDYRFNPRKGWALTLRGVAGFNSVLRNNQIEALRDPSDPDFRFAGLYDGVAQRAARFRLEGRAEYFIPVFARSAILLRARGGGIFSEKPVYANEQYRLGGNKLLRGFDEESLFATRFAVATAELRLLLSQNAYMAAFTDYGYLANLTDRNRFFLRPWGLGAGLNFETPSGIFGISLAVGRRDAGQAVDWRAPKFHLGYINLF